MSLHSLLSLARDWRQRRATESAIQDYLAHGQTPWGTGYSEYKERYIASALKDSAVMNCFATETPLPVHYGAHLDERVVEIPHTLATLASVQSGRLLDAGSSLNFEYILHHPHVTRHQTIITTLAPEPACFWKDGVSYVFADLRDLPFRDHYFDTIVSISTLEHIGLENSHYAPSAQHAHPGSPDDFCLVARELRRVLKPGGCAVISVPYGVYHSFGWFQQFDAPLLTRLINSFAPTRHTESYYRYNAQGWHRAVASECADAHYSTAATHAAPPSSTMLQDGAAAARAVVIVTLWG